MRLRLGAALLLTGVALVPAARPALAQTVAGAPGGALPFSATARPTLPGSVADEATPDPAATAAINGLGDDEALQGALSLDDDRVRENLREGTVDGLKATLDTTRNDAQGIPLGTFTLKPSLGQTLNHESTRNGDGSRESRTYTETGLKGTLTSDWSRHQLTVTGEGYWQKNISGSGETEPRASIDADLRLDITRATTASLRAGYAFDREDATDPNAIENATTQAGVNRYSLGAGLEHDFGILRGAARVDLERYAYSDARLSNGGRLSTADRDRDVGTVTGRIGYELSPALVPFIEASLGRGRYDLRLDSNGYARSYDTLSGRGGVELDLGEKLNGELSLGYARYRFDDARLKDLNGVTVEGLINWSPLRGTDVTYGLSTTLEPSTTSGESGALAYTLSSRLTHELRSALVARLSSSLTLRNYPSGAASNDQKVWLAGAGLTYDINRYLALTGDVSYERTMNEGGNSTNVARIGVGLTLRR